MRHFVIWSHEHRMWWGPDRAGYVADLVNAGRYTFQEAADITVDHVPPGEEVAIDFEIAARHGSTVVWASLLDDPDYHIEKRT